MVITCSSHSPSSIDNASLDCFVLFLDYTRYPFKFDQLNTICTGAVSCSPAQITASYWDARCRDLGCAWNPGLAQAAAGIGPNVAWSVFPVQPRFLLNVKYLITFQLVVPLLGNCAARTAGDACTALAGSIVGAVCQMVRVWSRGGLQFLVDHEAVAAYPDPFRGD